MEEKSSTQTFLSDISERDKPWDIHRAEAMEVQRLYEGSDYQPYADRIEKCSPLLGFIRDESDDQAIRMKLETAKFCRCRHCPVCQWRRSLKWRARVFDAIPKIKVDHPKAKFIFLTLTIRNCPIQDLKFQIKMMNQAFRSMTRLKRWPAIGCIKALEVSRGSDGSAHPHFHCVLMVSSRYFKSDAYIRHEEWQEMWMRALKIDYLPQVRVQAIKEIEKGLLETIKYSVKPADLISDRDWLIALTQQLHKSRAISISGIFREYLSSSDPEDLIHDESEKENLSPKEIDFFFAWREHQRRYVFVEKNKEDKTKMDELKDKIDNAKQNKIIEPQHFKDYDEYEIEDWIRLGNIEEALAMGKDKIIDKIEPDSSPIDKIKGMRAQWNDEAMLFAQTFPEHKGRSRHFI